MSHPNVRFSNLNTRSIVVIGGLHVLASLAIFQFERYFSWTGLGICLFLFGVSIWVGIGLCYHRLLTHKSFETSRWFKHVFTLAGTLSLQGGPLDWVGKHRVHHQNTDRDSDLHTPRHGIDWAHIGWIIFRLSKEQRAEVRQMAKDLERDRIMVWINKLFWLPQVILTILLFCTGYYYGGQNIDMAFSWLIWGVGVRTVAGYHITWFVNSAGHKLGYRNYDTKDDSTNNWWVALLSWGEGWHNNHHMCPQSASHGQRWFELDLTYLMIKLLEQFGLVWNIAPFKIKSQAEQVSGVKA